MPTLPGAGGSAVFPAGRVGRPKPTQLRAVVRAGTPVGGWSRVGGVPVHGLVPHTDYGIRCLDETVPTAEEGSARSTPVGAAAVGPR